MVHRLAVVVLVVSCAAAAADSKEDAKAANVRGMQLYGKKDYAAAAKEFRAAIAAQPEFVLAHYNLASMAALLGDKATVIAELTWLRDSKDPAARKVLDKAPTDPDLKSMIDDPAVRALVTPDCSSICSRELADCGKSCSSRDCMHSACDLPREDCSDGCKLGMTADARTRMRAWLAGPLKGHDNDVAAMRAAAIESHRPSPDGPRFTAFIKNQFAFMCALEWAPSGAPAALTSCAAGDKKWQADDARIALQCTLSTKQKVDHCEGKFTLSSGDFHDEGRFVLERALK